MPWQGTRRIVSSFASPVPPPLPSRHPRAAGVDLERTQGRALQASDAPALRDAVASLAGTAALSERVLDPRAVEAYAAGAEELAPVSAVLGGTLANEVVKALSRRGEPLRNFFFFTLLDGTGSVDLLG